MENLPLVSILLPVHNVDEYVVQAVNSLKSQTYDNIEIIIIDDCSTDGTYEVCEKLALSDSRIRLYRNSKNLKIAETLNRAFQLSKGMYIARMDGDDISSLDRIQRQINFLLLNPGVDLVGVSLVGIDASGAVISNFEHHSDFNFLCKTAKYVTPVSHVWMANRRVYEILCGYRNIPGCEDYDFLLRMLSSKLIFSNIPGYFGYYVRLQRGGNTQASIGQRRRKIFSYVYDLYKERQSYGVDSFSLVRMEEKIHSSYFSDQVYKLSNYFLERAILKKKEGAILIYPILIIAALISPAQISYLLQRFMYRVNLLMYTKCKWFA